MNRYPSAANSTIIFIMCKTVIGLDLHTHHQIWLPTTLTRRTWIQCLACSDHYMCLLICDASYLAVINHVRYCCFPKMLFMIDIVWPEHKRFLNCIHFVYSYCIWFYIVVMQIAYNNDIIRINETSLITSRTFWRCCVKTILNLNVF